MEPDKLLSDLIALPSVNPAFLPPHDATGGEHLVAEYLAHCGRRAALDVEFQSVAVKRNNVLIRLTPIGAIRHRVVFAPHMDTVGVSSATQFKPTRKRGRLHGRGACDTKGSVAAMLSAIIKVSRMRDRPRNTEIILAALVDEEAGQGGSRHLARSGLNADLAIVGEPTELRVVTAHKGDLWLELSTRGRAAHGARPELGINAVHGMAKVVDLLETKYAAQLRRRRHRLLGPATINVGMIHGGTQPNIVPDRCSIRIDRRTIPGEKDPQVKREIVRFIRQHGMKVELVDTKAEEPAPALETSIGHPVLQRFLKAAEQKKPAGVDFFTDAGVLSAAGIPSVVFGPGNIAQAHTVDEWVEIKQLEKGARLLHRFLTSLS